MFIRGAFEIRERAQHPSGGGYLPGAADRLSQCSDLPRIELAALDGHSLLLLEDGDAIFDNEIGRRSQGAHRGECDDQPRSDANAAEREPFLQAHEWTFEQIATVLEHERRTKTPPSALPTPLLRCRACGRGLKIRRK